MPVLKMRHFLFTLALAFKAISYVMKLSDIKKIIIVT